MQSAMFERVTHFVSLILPKIKNGGLLFQGAEYRDLQYRLSYYNAPYYWLLQPSAAIKTKGTPMMVMPSGAGQRPFEEVHFIDDTA